MCGGFKEPLVLLRLFRVALVIIVYIVDGDTSSTGGERIGAVLIAGDAEVVVVVVAARCGPWKGDDSGTGTSIGECTTAITSISITGEGDVHVEGIDSWDRKRSKMLR